MKRLIFVPDSVASAHVCPRCPWATLQDFTEVAWPQRRDSLWCLGQNSI